MIKKLLIIIISSALLLLGFFIFAGNEAYTEPEVRLLTPSGFYQDKVLVDMEWANGDVYYTLDGSRPDENSLRFETGFYLGDASENENVYSMREDLSVSFLDEEIHEREAGSPEDYVLPDEKIHKCTVVRAVCIDPMGGRSKEESATYFVDFDEKTGYDGVYLVSLYTDPENLFDPKKGIYVTGNVTEEYLVSGEKAENDERWWWWPANYRMKGKDWERKAGIEIFNGDRDRIIAKDIGIRIQGGGSRGYLPRSMNLIASKEYDGEDDFGLDIFNAGYAPEVITLFSGGDSRVTKLEDYLPAMLAGDMNMSTMRFIPAVMFLNGEYWGFYFLTERYNESYFEGHYGVDRNQVIMIKEGEVSVGREADLQLYEEDMSFLKRVDVSEDKRIDEVEKRIDLDSYLDYYALQLYLDRRNDWPYMNVALWKCRDKETGVGSVKEGSEEESQEGSGKEGSEAESQEGSGKEGSEAKSQVGSGKEGLKAETGEGVEKDAGDFEGGSENYGDGRWRWMLFDDNSGAYGTSFVSSNSIENTRKVDPVFDNLMKSDKLYNELVDRMQKLAKENFEPERVRAFVEEYRALVTPVMKNEFDRFYGEKRDYEHSLQVRLDRFNIFFEGRAEYVLNEIKKR